MNELPIGFCAIPGYPRYGIDRTGRVYNRISNTFLSGSINPAGYLNYRIVDEDGYTKTWGAHRLVAFVYLFPGVDIEDLVVNHRDFNKLNNCPENLHWVTQRFNVIYSGPGGNIVKVSMRCADTGIVKEYNSITLCSDDTGLSADAIAYRLSFNGNRVFPERKQYRIGHDLSDWYIPSNINYEISTQSAIKAVLVKNLRSGEIRHFNSKSEAAQYLKTVPSVLTTRMKNGRQPTISDLNKIKLDDGSAWEEVSDPFLDFEKHNNARCIVRTCNGTSERRVFLTAIECARSIGIGASTLNYRLMNSPDIPFKEGYSVRYYSNSPGS